MRISVSVVASYKAITTDLIPMDVFPEMTLNDLRAIIEDELKVPAITQFFYYNNEPLIDNSKSLSEFNINEGDMLGLAIQDPEGQNRPRRRPEQGGASSQPQQRAREGPDAERVRLHMIADTRVMEQVRRQDPELANVANDPDQFHAAWDKRQRELARAQAEKEEQVELLNADPFNVEAQAKIEELIRQERVQENMHKALEENPESFGRVHMLYIEALVNNTPIKAFVDSGAQTTIMSPDAAERCGIKRLIDTRFAGMARGVGTAKILGRVHSAYIQVGQFSLASSFTVMEGKDVDLLLGLDMLKKHQMCIDLAQDALIIQGEMVPFLPENQLPKMMEDALDNEPKIAGPDGTTIGATTGTVEQAELPGPDSQAQSKPPSSKITIHPTGSKGNIHSSQSAQSSTVTTRQQPPSSAFDQPQAITAESIAKITELGFSREEAIQALEQVGGNVELAVGLLL